jgi:predicted small secreted protein
MRPLRMLITLTALSALAACNTINGFGEDINNAGHAISRAADSTKDRMSQQQN